MSDILWFSLHQPCLFLKPPDWCAAKKCDSHIVFTASWSTDPQNFQTDLVVMETEQTAGNVSSPAPGQTPVRTWLPSSTRGTSARLLSTVRIGCQTKINLRAELFDRSYSLWPETPFKTCFLPIGHIWKGSLNFFSSSSYIITTLQQSHFYN